MDKRAVEEAMARLFLVQDSLRRLERTVTDLENLCAASDGVMSALAWLQQARRAA